MLPDEIGSKEYILLSDLRRIYETRHHNAAILNILKDQVLKIDDSYFATRHAQERLTKRHILLTITDPQLDQITLVGRWCGLGAIVPMNTGDDTWVFDMTLSNQKASFNAKHTSIGFTIDQNGCRMGRCNQMTVWIFIAPEGYVDGAPGWERAPPGDSTGTPHMTRLQHRKFVLFLAKCLENIGIQDIYCVNPYADVANDIDFEQSTNIL